MTTTDFIAPPHSTYGEIYPPTKKNKGSRYDIVIFSDGMVLYGENIVNQIDAILGGVKITVTEQELDFLKNGTIELVLKYTRQLYINTMSA